MGQEFTENSEVKAFALKKVPEGLTILEVSSLKTRPGWVFPAPSWNFGGKWVIGRGIVKQTEKPQQDIARLLAGPPQASITEAEVAAEVVAAVDVDGDGKVDAAEVAAATGMTEAAASELIAKADADGDGKLSAEEIAAVPVMAEVSAKAEVPAKEECGT